MKQLLRIIIAFLTRQPSKVRNVFVGSQSCLDQNSKADCMNEKKIRCKGLPSSISNEIMQLCVLWITLLQTQL